jgi:hypothetical protein
VVSIVDSNGHNADQLHKHGAISDAEYVAMLEPIAVDLQVLQRRPHVGFPSMVKDLIAAIPKDSLGGTSPDFDPESAQYERARYALMRACEDAGAPFFGVDATGAG